VANGSWAIWGKSVELDMTSRTESPCHQSFIMAHGDGETGCASRGSRSCWTRRGRCLCRSTPCVNPASQLVSGCVPQGCVPVITGNPLLLTRPPVQPQFVQMQQKDVRSHRITSDGRPEPNRTRAIPAFLSSRDKQAILATGQHNQQKLMLQCCFCHRGFSAPC
jgi:hypothetical protein